MIDFAILLYVTSGPRKMYTSRIYGVKKKKKPWISRTRPQFFYAKRIYNNNREAVLFLPINKRSLHYWNTIEIFSYMEIKSKKKSFFLVTVQRYLYILFNIIFFWKYTYIQIIIVRTYTIHTILLLSKLTCITFFVSKHLWVTLCI